MSSHPAGDLVAVAKHEAAHATILLQATTGRFDSIEVRDAGAYLGAVVKPEGDPWELLVTLVAGAVADISLPVAQGDPEQALYHLMHAPCCKGDHDQAVALARELNPGESVAREAIRCAIGALGTYQEQWVSLQYAVFNAPVERGLYGQRRRVLAYECADGPTIAGRPWTDALSVWANPAVTIKDGRLTVHRPACVGVAT